MDSLVLVDMDLDEEKTEGQASDYEAGLLWGVSVCATCYREVDWGV